MVSYSVPSVVMSPEAPQIFPMAAVKGAIPWWGVLVNWIIGKWFLLWRV